VLKNSLRVRFHPRLGTKYADFGALLARFVVAMSSVLTFSTGWEILRSSHQASEAGNMIVVESGDPPGKWVWREKTSCP
jgi:hypothetical protein